MDCRERGLPRDTPRAPTPAEELPAVTNIETTERLLGIRHTTNANQHPDTHNPGDTDSQTA
jgi:hypothetical protein